jgi:hypothetical protein
VFCNPALNSIVPAGTKGSNRDGSCHSPSDIPCGGGIHRVIQSRSGECETQLLMAAFISSVAFLPASFVDNLLKRTSEV